jgi:glycosyltransferase involved in cell wall biosynthesis
LRVLNVNATLDPVSGGGTTERTFQLSRSMARAGTECAVLTLDGGLAPERMEALAGARVFALPLLWGRYYVPKVSLASLEKVRVAVEGSDVVHLMNHWTFLNAVVYLLARRLGKPYVVCPAGALPIYGRSRHLKAVYNRLVGYGIIRNAAGHVAITADEIPHFEAYGIKAGRVSVIPNGIDPSDYRAKDDAGFRQRYGLGGAPFILFVGRLNHIKGPDLLLKAFARAKYELPGHLLVFAGPDEGMLSELQKDVAGSMLGDRVRFVGYLGDEEKSRAYHAADLLVVPSRQEAMSIVALEAGICGTPVLLTDRCGFDEIGSAGGGRVVSASVEGLRAGLVELLEDPAGLTRMGENLRRLAQDRYTWNSAIEEYLKLYEHILGLRAQRGRSAGP